MTEVPLWINGQRRLASDKGTFEIHNPLTGELVGFSASATSQDCKEAVDAAQKAFNSWESSPATFKRSIFLKAAELLQTERYKEKIKKALKEECAAGDFWAALNAGASAFHCNEAAALVGNIKGESFPSATIPGGQCIVQRRAHGVILAISAWNSPVNLTFRSIAVPLACGNTAVIKSSEVSPRSQEIVSEVLHEAGLPAGVLNFVSFSRENSPRLTAELIANPYVRHINFTGGDRVGRILASEAAKYLKPCVLELGGKNAAVVLDDANVDAAARAIVNGGMLNTGQICMSTERVIVQRGAYKELLSRVTELSKSLKAGNIFNDPSLKLSSLFSEAHAENFVKSLSRAKEGGAEVVLGDLSRQGAIVQPHVLQNVKPGTQLWTSEVFGPVLIFAVVDTVDEAVELANSTDYSLVSSLWTNNLTRAIEVAPRLRSGGVVVNGATVHTEPGLGYAGLGGSSGYGRFDIDNFTEKRLITLLPGTQKFLPLCE